MLGESGDLGSLKIIYSHQIWTTQAYVHECAIVFGLSVVIVVAQHVLIECWLGSDTDISTSNENLSMEQRYVLRHTPRIEPQGQENLLETTSNGNENSG